MIRLTHLTAATDVDRVVSLGRKPSGLRDAKLREETIGDFGDTVALPPHLEGDEADPKQDSDRVADARLAYSVARIHDVGRQRVFS